MGHLLEAALKNLETSFEYEMERISKEIPKIDEAILEAAKNGYGSLYITPKLLEVDKGRGDIYVYDYEKVFKDKIEKFISDNYSKQGFKISYSIQDDICIVWKNRFE